MRFNKINTIFKPIEWVLLLEPSGEVTRHNRRTNYPFAVFIDKFVLLFFWAKYTDPDHACFIIDKFKSVIVQSGCVYALFNFVTKSLSVQLFTSPASHTFSNELPRGDILTDASDAVYNRA